MTEHQGPESSLARPGVRDLSAALWSLATPDHFDSEEPAERGIPYRSGSGRGIAPLADVYLPSRPSARSILLVHGGGFIVGSRRMKPMRYLASRFVSRGDTVCAIDYRMILRGGRLTEARQDVADGLRWWRGQVVARGLDPEGIFVMGLSAGGTLALLTAAAEPDLAGVVGVFGLYDLSRLAGPLASLLPRLLLHTSDRSRWAATSPVAGPHFPGPLLLIHGTRDALVPYSQMGQLAAARERRGLCTETAGFEGEPHGFFNRPGPASDRAVTAISDFMDRTLEEATGSDVGLAEQPSPDEVAEESLQGKPVEVVGVSEPGQDREGGE